MSGLGDLPNGQDSVALLTALNTGDSDIAAHIIADLSTDTLAVLAVTFGFTTLDAWRHMAILAEADPDDYVTARLAQLGRDVAT